MKTIRRKHIVVAMAVTATAVLAIMLAVGLVVTARLSHDGPAPTSLSAAGPVSAGASAAAAVTVAQPAHVPVLCYHYIRGSSNPLRLLRVFAYVVLSLPVLDENELWSVSARGFQTQMEYLVARGYTTVTLADLHEWQLGNRALPPKPVVITFDDGDESVYEYAYPVLRKHGLRATLFVVTEHVGRKWNTVRCLPWSRLREMKQSGVFDIQSHTHNLHYKVRDRDAGTHPVFVAAADHGHSFAGAEDWQEVLHDDLARSRDAIQRHIGRSPEFLAWPYGAATAELSRVAAEAGFVRTCSLRARPNPPLARPPLPEDTEHFEIARYTITARTSLRVFREMLAGTHRPRV